MADLTPMPRGSGWRTDAATTNPETSTYDEAALLGDYVLVISCVDYLAAASNPGTPTCPTIASFTALASAADPASGSTVESIKAWLGRITTEPTNAASRTISISQTGSSGLHVATRVYYAGSSDATLALDGSGTAIVDRATPYTHASATSIGTLDLLVCAFGAVQFTGTPLAYGVPAWATETAQVYANEFSGLQVATQQLTSALTTGTRDQTSNVATLSGGAGVRFLLRAQGTAPVVVASDQGTRYMHAL